ncbi:MAG: class I SAM-dependent methyltransferase [Thermomicrobiales bacterium]
MSHSQQTSTGHTASGSDWLDLHFEVNRPEYTQVVEMAGFEPGWSVLDAGCGSGSYLPLLADRIGKEGRITAIDIAPENVALTRERLEHWRLPCTITIQEASALALPFHDNTFDAVWCANVTQYLTDDELDQMLLEFVRVTRPDGLVALKDVPLIFEQVEPAPANAISITMAQKARQGTLQAQGGMRVSQLMRFLERSGLTAVAQRTVLVERRAPLNRAERQLYAEFLAYLGQAAPELSLPDEYQQFWSRQVDPDSPDAVINHPELYFVEGQALATGRVPA